jgi:hypothetical protein
MYLRQLEDYFEYKLQVASPQALSLVEASINGWDGPKAAATLISQGRIYVAPSAEWDEKNDIPRYHIKTCQRGWDRQSPEFYGRRMLENSKLDKRRGHTQAGVKRQRRKR